MAPRSDAMKSSKLFRSVKSGGGGGGIRNLGPRSSGNSEKSKSPSSGGWEGGMMSTAEMAAQVADGYNSGEGSDDDELDAQSKTGDDDSDDESDDEDSSSNKDLDGSVGSKQHVLDSNALLAKLGTSPTEEEIASLAATRAQEYIVECFDDDSSNLDKEKFDAIPRYTKSDLMIGQFLGKGSFSDAFEVILTVHATQPKLKPGGGSDVEKDGGEDLDSLVAAAAGQFGGNDGSAGDSKQTSLHSSLHQLRNDVDPPARRRPRGASASHLSRSVCLGTVQYPAVVKPTRKTLAMKCLRPQIRANAEHFLIGVEDLIHETAMLAALDHPNIIKIHGRSGGSVSDSFRLSDGYFILLDRLTDTLEDRIKQWQKAPLASKKGPTANQIKVFSAIADAILFLHQNHICFRDLKPANVGFSDTGVLKLFDFGFACSVDKENPNSLTEKCGTLRYMAPEVGLGLGYGLEADVFSFGIMLWEVCSLKKPFSKVKSAEQFEALVFEKDTRPKIKKSWNVALKNLIAECWSRDPKQRPAMSVVKSILAALDHDLSKRHTNGSSFGKSLRSSIARRVTWD